ncbi:MAG TPA: twin-arginine translocase subunit TatC, partial [Halococcus sp.]|nr:twin-arginine translocase subunit TatC [Halococcus sp.]
MSGADEDVRRTVARGRETLGALLSAAQTHLQKVAIVFFVVFIGTFYALRLYVWNLLKADLFGQMSPAVARQTKVIATTPFDVPLLQVKIGLVVGALVSLPLLFYYSRDALKRRGYWPTLKYGRLTVAAVGLLALVLFAGGVAYAYIYLFPLLFKFLASNALAAGFQPTYSIVEWAQFVFILSLAMGIAAELPLVMVATVYAGVVPPGFYREKWRHAIVAIAVVASVINGSPDPFSMSLVAVPMTALYGVGLVFTTIVAGVKTGRSPKTTLRARWRRVVAIPLV